MALARKRKMEIPDFAIEDIMGEFDVDDQGNFVLFRNDENGDLEDRNRKRVNRRGYLVDKYNNVVDKYGNLIFKEKELDSDEEIPPPYSFEKRKMQLLNTKSDPVEKYHEEEMSPEDDRHIWMDQKGRDLAEAMSGDETPVESMMGETPGRHLQQKKNKRMSFNNNNTKTINEDYINIDLDSQKNTVKLESTFRPGSIKSSNKTKRLISARVKNTKRPQGVDTMIDGFVKDIPFYFNGMPNNVQDSSVRNTPKQVRKKLRKKGPHDSSLKKIYGNIDPFLYKDESRNSGVRFDKVIHLNNNRRADNFRLAESTEIDAKINDINIDEEIDSEIYRNSHLDRYPSKYKERTTLGETSIKNKLDDLEDIYHTESKHKRESDRAGHKSHYSTRINKLGPYNENSNTITRNMFSAETNSMISDKKNKNHTKKARKGYQNRPSLDNGL